MKKKNKFTKKFKLIKTSDKKRIRGGKGGLLNILLDIDLGDNNNGGVPPYQPGGQGDDDKEK